MKAFKWIWLIGLVLLVLIPQASAMLNLSLILEEIGTLQEEGRLSEADEKARQALQEHGDTLTPEHRQWLEFEIERSRRIRMDYSVTEERLIQSLKESLRDFTPEEFRQWENEGRFDVKLIDGQKRFVGPSRSNLLFRFPELRQRRLKPPDTSLEEFIWKHYQEIKAEFQSLSQSTVKPRHFQLEMTITVKPDVVPKGETIRCWMPYPQQFEAQSGVELLASTPEVSWINHPLYPMRSIYFEQPSLGKEPTPFGAKYLLTTYPRYNPVDPIQVLQNDRFDPNFFFYVREQSPHVDFHPLIRQMAMEIGQGDSNPYFRARRFYDWISRNIQYSYAREYSTLRNISHYTLQNRYGDCGQIALLFITLCRASDIPARWESGWMLYPMLTNLHDWARIYIEPYGWIPVDPYMGVFFEQKAEALTTEQRRELQDFYFGGMDAYRLVVNSDHGYAHYPPRESFRSDTVDFQRGELEAAGKNIYFDQFNYRLKVDYLDAEPSGDLKEQEPRALLEPGLAR